MNEDKNNQNDRPKEEPKPSDESQVKYREISEDELKQIIEEHEKWVESGEKEGKKANLKVTNLQKANLALANLQQAILREANLQDAFLEEINLQQAILRKANLQEAYLVRANMQKAQLGETNLQRANLMEANLKNADLSRAGMQKTVLDGIKGLASANLQYANFEGATGLLGNEFVQADVTGTKLPDDIKEFRALEIVKETSQNARKIFFAMLLGCVYSWLTIATTTDVKLLTNTASSPLPIIGTEIPIAWFYIAAPLVLLCLYFYFHFYLLGLWEGLASLPAIFPDGKRLDERAYPWLLNRLVRRHFKLLKKDRPIMAKLQELVVIALAWWVVPITMVGFWLRYLVRHEFIGTFIHIVLLIILIASSLIFYNLCKLILQGNDIKNYKLSDFWNNKKSYIVIAIGFILIVSSNIGFSNWGANLREQDISIKPNDYYKIVDWKEKIESVKGANLNRRNLKNSDMSLSFLVKADLKDTNIQNADFEGANLRSANLQQADFSYANLQNAVFKIANLQNAVLVETNLQNADFSYADLQNATFKIANFQNAVLVETNLMYADLTGAKNLTIEQLSKVKTLYQAKLDPKLMEQVKKCCPNLLEKPKKETQLPILNLRKTSK